MILLPLYPSTPAKTHKSTEFWTLVGPSGLGKLRSDFRRAGQCAQCARHVVLHANRVLAWLAS